MCFSNSPDSLGVYHGDKIDVLFNLDINEWMGRKNVQLIVKDIKPSVSTTEMFEQEKKRFVEIWNGDSFSADENLLPSREDFVAVYKFVVAASRTGMDTFSHRELASKLSSGPEYINIGYVKLKIIIKVLQELNLLGIDEVEEETYKFTVRYSQKTNLEKSGLLRRLRNQQKKA